MSAEAKYLLYARVTLQIHELNYIGMIRVHISLHDVKGRRSSLEFNSDLKGFDKP